jgi:hypothetical protein
MGGKRLNSIYPNIDAELSKRGLTYHHLADELGMRHLAMYRRLAGITRFTLVEALEIRKVFNGEDINYLFQMKERG